MMFGRMPFDDQSIQKIYEKIKKGAYKIPDFASDKLKNLLTGILQVQPTKRLTIEEILKHGWVADETCQSAKQDAINDDVLVDVCQIYGIDPKLLQK